MISRPPGMMDVARLAGVSHQTVSRVLNDHPLVAPATRQRVLDAIAELGYRRNSAARTLVSGRSGTVGVVMPSSGLFGPVSTLIAIERAARAAGLFVSVASLRDGAGSSMRDALEHFRDQSVEAVVVIAPQTGVIEAAASTASRVPVVVVAADTEHVGPFHQIYVDQEGGARLVVRHLLELGHERIAHVAGPPDWFDATARIRGWRQEVRAAKSRPGALIQGDWTAASGYAAGLRLARGPLPSAVFAGNDQMALGLVRALGESGIRVPQDVSVVGFDDVEGADHFRPPLTTVRQRFDKLGEQCLEMVRAALAGRPIEMPPIAPELIVRESSGPPP